MHGDVRLDQHQAEELQAQETTRGFMVMWTVTWNTSDYPRRAAARPQLIGRGGTIAPLLSVLLADSLDELRQQLPRQLVKLERDPDDDPVIIEIWL